MMEDDAAIDHALVVFLNSDGAKNVFPRFYSAEGKALYRDSMRRAINAYLMTRLGNPPDCVQPDQQ